MKNKHDPRLDEFITRCGDAEIWRERIDYYMDEYHVSFQDAVRMIEEANMDAAYWQREMKR